MQPRSIQRRSFLALIAGAAPLAVLVGCDDDRGGIGRLLTSWGRAGLADGRFNKPRAMAIDAHDQIYVVDITARIQVFTREGEFLRGWTTPVHDNGRPTGLGIDHRGNLMVPDTHYYRVLFYSPEGELLETLGGTMGPGPSEFGFVTDVIEDAEGNLYVSEYGEYDRVQKFSPKHEYLMEFGGHGDKPGKFSRPQCMAIDARQRIWISDACNHRVQSFDTNGKLLSVWGTQGSEPGQLSYPYGLVLDEQGNVYVSEFGNHRVQKFTPEGRSLGCWGTHGRAPGELHNPWALVRDSLGRTHVLDTGNNRVQVIQI